MKTFEIKTLVDVTNTKVARPNQGTELEHNQYRNFVTLNQCIEIRSIISYDFFPKMQTIDIKELGFGSKYKGKHSVWTFRFNTDRPDVYTNETGDLGCLYEDLQGVPIVKNLTETINIEKAILDLIDSSYRNTIIKAIDDII